MRYLLILILMASSVPGASADSTDVSEIQIRQYRFVARLNMIYVPVNSIDFTNFDQTYEVYDNIYYRFGIEYAFSSLFSAGPSFEYMKKYIEPHSTFKRDITAFNVLADFKLNHNVTDNGSTKMIFGFGTGIAGLNEESGDSNTGIIFYVATGFDIAIRSNLGLDFIYRYQLSRLKVEYRDYKYDGSVIQFGLNYGINL